MIYIFALPTYHSAAMVSRDFRPLCSTHREVMIPLTGAYHAFPESAEIAHCCECPVDGCLQNYSPGFGYFSFRPNDDYWTGTNSPSFRIIRDSTQVICGLHRHSMFIESFDALRNLEKFRCPGADCPQTMEILIGGPPVYWLGLGYFDAA